MGYYAGLCVERGLDGDREVLSTDLNRITRFRSSAAVT